MQNSQLETRFPVVRVTLDIMLDWFLVFFLFTALPGKRICPVYEKIREIRKITNSDFFKEEYPNQDNDEISWSGTFFCMKSSLLSSNHHICVICAIKRYDKIKG